MTPLHIQIGLHYFARADEYAAHEPAHRNSGATRECLQDFVSCGLLKKLDQPNQYGATYEGTEGLKVWAQALCKVPLPIQQWVVPATPQGQGLT